MYTHVMFDLDGTLLNTIDDLANAGNWVCTQRGWPTHTVEAYKTKVGNGIPKLVERFAPQGTSQQELEEALAQFMDYYGQHKEDLTAPYWGMAQVLDALKQAGVGIGVLTNKAHSLAGAVMERYYPGVFTHIQGALPHQPTKPDPTLLYALMEQMGAKAETTLFVGDSNVDIRTGKNGRLDTCGVLWGFRDREELLENADMAVNHVKRSGKNGIEIFDTILRENLVQDDETDHRNIYRGYESTIYALTAAIDVKDHYTFSHSNNVAYYATSLAKELSLNSDMVEIIRQAALLHDVGKIGIPEAILNKAGKLTEEEYEIIKGHVEASIGIIRHLPSLDYVIPAVIGHHERYDGRGYPRRTVGENIPLSARILCIADSFDAMTTKRSYKDVIPKERALQILEEEAGKQFDPKLVPVFVCGMQEGRIQMANEAGERK